MAASERYIAEIASEYNGYHIFATPIESEWGGWRCNLRISADEPQFPVKVACLAGPFETPDAAHAAAVSVAEAIIDGKPVIHKIEYRVAGN